jgi:large subunit ribosomal protein L31
MKEDIHPPYQEVLFVDSSTGYKFVCGTTLQTAEREVFEGKEYPVYRVSVSSASHPAFTGAKQFIDTEGRVDKFFKRYGGKGGGQQQGRQEEGDKQEPKGKGKK